MNSHGSPWHVWPLLTASLACWLGTTGLVLAQAVPGQYQVTAKLAPAKIAFSKVTSSPRFLNERGEVGGWATQSAGTVWSWVPETPIFSTATGRLKLMAIPQINGWPVTWTGATPRIWPRYKNTTSTWPLDYGSDDTLVAAVAPKAGTVASLYAADTSSNLGLEQPPADAQIVLLKNGQYTALPTNTFKPGYSVLANARGTVVGAAFDSAYPRLLRNGQTIDIPPAFIWGSEFGSEFSWQAVAINEHDTVLLHGSYYGNVKPSRCFLWREGQITEIKLPDGDTVANLVCHGLNNADMVAGFAVWRQVNKAAIGDKRLVFRWQEGRMDTSSYDPGSAGPAYPWRMHIDGAGLIAFHIDTSGAYLYATGAPVPLMPRISGAASSSVNPVVQDMNEAGQMLVKGISGTDMPWVISPVK